MASAVAMANVRAEMRAVESGNIARLSADGSCLLVKSESQPGVTHRVVPSGVDGLLVVSCSCPWGHSGAPVPGVAGCRHAATAARRMERAGLVSFDGERWVVTADA